MFLNIPDWLIVLDIAAIIVIIVSTAFRSEIGAGIVVVLGLFVNLFIFIGNPIFWVTQNVDKTLEFIAAYLLIGVVWGVIRWRFIYLNSADVKSMVLDSYNNWTKYVKDGTPFKKSNYYPFSWQKDSSMITTWVLLWPLSMIWTFLSEFLTRLGTHIWNFAKWVGRSFGNLYGKMAENKVDNILKNNRSQE